MFHDQKENEQHYEKVLQSKSSLYFERFDEELLEKRPFVAQLLKQAFERHFPQNAETVLDLGCGTGFYFPLLAVHANELIGIDVCQSMLDQAQHTIDTRALANCRVLRSSAGELPIEDQSVDVVHSWDFLHHVEDVSKVFGEIRRVLKPGGRYIAVEPNLLNPSIAWYHARRRSEWRLFVQNQFTMPRQLRHHFDVRVSYDNTIISFLNDRTYWIWKSVERLTSITLFRWLAFRYILDCRLQSTPNSALL
jgi:ubiquinone/menaquinone biosynthesis C-methylase UbiE